MKNGSEKRLMKIALACCGLMLALGQPLSAAVIQPVALPPFTFAGRIVDYAHIAYDADSQVEVRVKAQDGTLLAKTKTRTSGATSFNYAVDVPLASADISGHVKVGDAVVFEFVDPSGTVYSGLVPSASAVLGEPGGFRAVDVILATDANHDGVADEYVETLEYLMWINGISEYDPKADYDGDGVSNLAEYVAGTNPFDKTDKFSVRQMALDSGLENFVALKFQVSQGRVYSVLTTQELVPDATWKNTDFAVSDPSAALSARFSTGPAEVGYRVIYLPKGTDPSRFWKLKVE